MDDRPASPPCPPRPPPMPEQREEVPPPRPTDNGCEEGIHGAPPTPDPSPTSVAPLSPAAPQHFRSSARPCGSPRHITAPVVQEGKKKKKKKSRPHLFLASSFPPTAPPSPMPLGCLSPVSSHPPAFTDPFPMATRPHRLNPPPLLPPRPSSSSPSSPAANGHFYCVSLGAKPSRDRPGRCQPHSPAENGWRGTPDPPNSPPFFLLAASRTPSRPLPRRTAPGGLPRARSAASLTCGEPGRHLSEGRGLHAQVFLRGGGSGGEGGRGGWGRGWQWRTSPSLRGRRAQQRVEIQSPFQSGAASHGAQRPRGLGARGSGGDSSSRPCPEASSPLSGVGWGGGKGKEGAAASGPPPPPPRRPLSRERPRQQQQQPRFSPAGSPLSSPAPPCPAGTNSARGRWRDTRSAERRGAGPRCAVRGGRCGAMAMAGPGRRRWRRRWRSRP